MTKKKSKVVAIIPARVGSKRLPGKNIKILNGKPLICYTIEEAIKCHFINEIIITTNDPEVISICQQYAYDPRILLVDRPEELAEDITPMYEVILHACEGYSWGLEVILLQPTSPLRDHTDIYMCHQLYHKGLGVISVYQEDELRFKLNGAIYVQGLGFIQIKKKFIANNMIFYIMSKERSIDIDTLEDFEKAEVYLKCK